MAKNKMWSRAQNTSSDNDFMNEEVSLERSLIFWNCGMEECEAMAI